MKEKKGLNKFVRLEALTPVIVILALIVAYFTFFFDNHVRLGLEWGLTRALGAEVNISDFDTKISDLSMKIRKIEITDSNRPQQNVVEVGEIRFSAVWDAILRAKLVVNEAVVERIEFGTPRKSPGKVLPPSPEESGPSIVDEVKDKALSTTKKEYSDNILGDAAAWLGDTKQDPLAGIKADVVSKELIEKFQKEVEAKRKSWDARLKELPRPEEFKALGDRLQKVKTSNFKNPAEVAQSVQELDRIFKEADQKLKALDSANKDLNSDIKRIESEVKSIQAQVNQDIKDLEKRLKIPKLDPQSLAAAVFMSYIEPYKEKFFRYKNLADKYMPPNLKKKGSDNPDESMQPRPRAKGVSYEFGRPRSYPLFWIKKTRITSQAGTSPHSGNIEGEIRHISSNQVLTNEPIVAEIRGSFPNAKLIGLQTLASLDNRHLESKIDAKFSLESYPVATPKVLVKSPDLTLKLAESNGRLSVESQIISLKKYSLNIRSFLKDFTFETESKEKVVQEIFSQAFANLPEISIIAKASGTFPSFPLQLDSNLGRELGKALEVQLRAQIEQAKKELQAQVENEIGKHRDALNQQINALRNQVQGELHKLQAQAESQKKQAENQIKSAKKGGEKKLEKDAEKALKKLFGK